MMNFRRHARWSDDAVGRSRERARRGVGDDATMAVVCARAVCECANEWNELKECARL